MFTFSDVLGEVDTNITPTTKFYLVEARDGYRLLAVSTLAEFVQLDLYPYTRIWSINTQKLLDTVVLDLNARDVIFPNNKLRTDLLSLHEVIQYLKIDPTNPALYPSGIAELRLIEATRFAREHILEVGNARLDLARFRRQFEQRSEALPHGNFQSAGAELSPVTVIADMHGSIDRPEANQVQPRARAGRISALEFQRGIRSLLQHARTLVAENKNARQERFIAELSQRRSVQNSDNFESSLDLDYFTESSIQHFNAMHSEEEQVLRTVVQTANISFYLLMMITMHATELATVGADVVNQRLAFKRQVGAMLVTFGAVVFCLYSEHIRQESTSGVLRAPRDFAAGYPPDEELYGPSSSEPESVTGSRAQAEPFTIDTFPDVPRPSYQIQEINGRLMFFPPPAERAPIGAGLITSIPVSSMLSSIGLGPIERLERIRAARRPSEDSSSDNEESPDPSTQSNGFGGSR